MFQIEEQETVTIMSKTSSSTTIADEEDIPTDANDDDTTEDISAKAMSDDSDEKMSPPNAFTAGAITMSDLAHTPLPKVDFLVERLALSPGRPSVIYGAAGKGKTVVVTHIAACVGLNQKLFGLYDVTPAEVLILDFELGQMEESIRIRQQIEGLGASLEDAPGISFKSFPRLRMDEPDARDHLMRATEGKGLVIIDPLSRATSCSENDSRGVSDALAMTAQVSTETGAVICWVHHAGKRASAGLRGSSTIMDASQCVLRVSSPRAGQITLEQVKAVPISVPPVFLQLEEVGGIAPETRRARGLKLVEYNPDQGIEERPEKPDARHQIIAVLEEHRGGLGGRALRSAVGGNTQRYVQSLRVLVAQEIVVATPDKNDGRKTVYRLRRYMDDFEPSEGQLIQFPGRVQSDEGDDV